MTLKLTAQDLENEITGEEYLHPQMLPSMTICVLHTRSGFAVTGTSCPISADNLNVEMGRKIARDNAFNELWPLMGFHEKQKRIG